MLVTWNNSKSCYIAVILFVLLGLITFNINYLHQDIGYGLSTNNNNVEKSQSSNYLIVIGSRVEFGSRRELIRSSYFGIQDNLVPITPSQKRVQYAFCIYGEPPSSNTVEKRTFETEKMEYNDIYIMDKSIEYKIDSVLDWVTKRETIDSLHSVTNY